MIKDGIVSLTTGMGTDRDKSASVVYVAPVRDNTQEYVAAYRTSWLARRIVDQVAEDCFRKWRAWQAPADQISKIEATEKRLDARAKLERALIMARLKKRAFVYISVKGDAERLAEPLNPERVRRGGIDFLQVLTESEVAEGPIDIDPLSPGYGKPEYFEISGSTSLVRIHPTRLVEFQGNQLPQDWVFGREAESVLTDKLSAIKRYDSIIHNVAGMTHDARVRVLYIQNLARHLEDPESEALALKRALAFQQGIGNFGLGLLDAGDPNLQQDTGERLDQSTTSFATLPDVIQKAQEDVSAAARMPRAILFGTGAGGLGANGDLELSAYYDHVNMIQSNELQPAMAILDECIIRDALGSRPLDIYYNWNSLWQQSDKEKAELADKLAGAIQKTIASGAIPAEVMTKSAVNAFTESGIFPGLEQDYEDWVAGGGMDDLPEQGEDMNVDPATA